MKRYFIFVVMPLSVLFLNIHSLVANQAQESLHNYKLSGHIEGETRVIEVNASRYKFEPDPIVVSLGDKVRLLVTSTDVNHGLAIPDFKVNLTIPSGKTASVEFIADKQGTFHAHCSVYCGPGHSHMHAVFIVR